MENYDQRESLYEAKRDARSLSAARQQFNGLQGTAPGGMSFEGLLQGLQNIANLSGEIAGDLNQNVGAITGLYIGPSEDSGERADSLIGRARLLGDVIHRNLLAIEEANRNLSLVTGRDQNSAL